jgi:hypothetical protein
MSSCDLEEHSFPYLLRKGMLSLQTGSSDFLYLIIVGSGPSEADHLANRTGLSMNQHIIFSDHTFGLSGLHLQLLTHPELRPGIT